MAKCIFCGTQIEPGTGKMFVYNSGKIIFFCSSKCEKNLFKLKRKPLETRWTAEYRREHKKGSVEKAKPLLSKKTTVTAEKIDEKTQEKP